jgi:hypothetical protein
MFATSIFIEIWFERVVKVVDEVDEVVDLVDGVDSVARLWRWRAFLLWGRCEIQPEIRRCV